MLRRIMRRAIRNMRLLGATGPVVKDLIDVVIGMMGQQYPELITDRERIEEGRPRRGERLPGRP